MAEFVAQDMIRSYVDRIRRLKDEARELNRDIREIYAEAKSNGFDKTILGKVVNYVEKREEDRDAVTESEALFDMYLSAYDGRVGTRIATHAHETKTEPLPPADTAAQEGGTPTSARDCSSGRTEPSADGHIPVRDAEEVTGEPKATADLNPEQMAHIHRPEPQSQAKASTGNDATVSAMERPNDSMSGEASRPSREGGVPAIHSPAEPSSSVLNPRCLKAQKGEDCWMAHKSFCCSDCTSVWALNRQPGKRVPA